MRQIKMSVFFLCIFSFTQLVIGTNSLNNYQTPVSPDVNLHSSARWTIMYYMCCDSEGMDPYSEPLLQNLSKIKSTNRLNIVVLNDRYGYGDTNLYYVDRNGSLIELNDLFNWPCEVDTSNPVTFQEFCRQMMEYFPADHYGLITYAGGGTGWQLFCLHDQSQAGRGITLPSLADCFQKITDDGLQPIDVVMVSCAMGTIELAYELSPYVQYIIGTQDCFEQQDLVARFYQFTWDLHNNTDLSPEQLASCAPKHLQPHPFYYAESYFGKLPLVNRLFNRLAFPRLHAVIHYPSSSVINLSKIQDLTERISEISEFLILHLPEVDIRNAIANARKQVRESGKCYQKTRLPLLSRTPITFEFLAYDAFIDLYHFFSLLTNTTDDETLRNHCISLLNKMNETIPWIKKVPGDESHGLNMYFPETKAMYNKYVLPGKIPCPYEHLGFSHSSSWDDFLIQYLT